MAKVILSRFASRRIGPFVNIEAIIEDSGITPLPRRGGLHKFVNGYLAKDPKFIVVPESYSSYPPRYRTILAEEYSHIVLEYDLLSKGLPAESEAHCISFDQHQIIERDAQYLARAVLMPEDIFPQLWKQSFDNTPAAKCVVETDHYIYCVDALEQQFEVWPLTIAYRARDLTLITDAQCREHFSNRIVF